MFWCCWSNSKLESPQMQNMWWTRPRIFLSDSLAACLALRRFPSPHEDEAPAVALAPFVIMFLPGFPQRGESSRTSTLALGVLACAGAAQAFAPSSVLPSSAPGLRASGTCRPATALTMGAAVKGGPKLSKFEQMRQKYQK